MTATRSTQEEYAYRRYRKHESNDTCSFCEITEKHPQFVEQTIFFKVIRNRFPYSVWDGQGVIDHLMIIPKKHVDGFGGIPPKASAEYFALLGKYEKENYNLYARAPLSSVKSIVHQHTHLLRLDGRKKKHIFFLTRPFYHRWSI